MQLSIHSHPLNQYLQTIVQKHPCGRVYLQQSVQVDLQRKKRAANDVKKTLQEQM